MASSSPKKNATRRNKRDTQKPAPVAEEKVPSLAQQVFGMLSQIASMYVISLIILYTMRKFNIAQAPDEGEGSASSE